MARQRVVMVGEFHGFREHHAFLLDVIRSLHAHGTRLLLLEGFQAESVAANAFVRGRIDSLHPSTQKYFGFTLDGLRAYNASLIGAGRPDDVIGVAFVDINHRPWAFPLALASLRAGSTEPDCVGTFLTDTGWDQTLDIADAQARFEKAFAADPVVYRARLELLQTQLKEGACPPPSPLVDADAFSEMVDVALESLTIRSVWDTEGEAAAHPAREDAIKKMIDRQLSKSTGPVVINMGGFHLQKAHVLGMPKEWVGEYLARKDHFARGQVFRLFVSFARAQRRSGDETTWWTLRQEDAATELFSAMAQFAGGSAAYLPLDAPAFRQPLKIDYMFQTKTHPPAEAFDAFVVLPEGTLMY